MSGVDPQWPQLKTDVARLQSAVREQVASVSLSDALTSAELSDRVELLTTQLERLSAELDNRISSADAERDATYVRADDVARHVESCLIEFGQLGPAANGTDQTTSELVGRLEADLATIDARLGNLGFEVDGLRSEQVVLEQRHDELATQSDQRLEDLLSEAERLRETAEESRQLVEKAVDKADTALANNDALQADFDAASSEVTRRLNELDVRLQAFDMGNSQGAAGGPSLVEAQSRLARLESFAHEQGRYGATLSAAITKHLEGIDSRLRMLEVDPSATQPLSPYSMHPASPPQQPPATIDLTDSRPAPPIGWQFERRNSQVGREE